MSTTHDRDKEVGALASLHQAEVSANIGELQATTTLVLGLLAYLASTVFLIDSLQPRLLALLPFGVIFGCTYQMLRAAVVVRRAAVAREYERALAGVVGFQNELDRGEIGSRFYGALDDIGVILSNKGAGMIPKFFVAVVAYFGLYALAATYTLLVMLEVHDRAGDVQWVAAYSVLYAIVWCLLLVAAGFLFWPREVARIS